MAALVPQILWLDVCKMGASYDLTTIFIYVNGHDSEPEPVPGL